MKAEIVLATLKDGAEVAAAFATKSASAKNGLLALAQKNGLDHRKRWAKLNQPF